MSVAVSKAGPYYTSGSISFSSLRSNFRAQRRKQSSSDSETFAADNESIKASQLRRITSNSDTNPIVPNSTENSSITVSSNWKTSQFRNSIKFYYLTQTGTDDNFDIDAQSWNSNLTNNTSKFIFINGYCGSNSVSSPGATFNATAYNLTIDVYGYIYGCGGRGGGTSGAPNPSGEGGGDALSVISSSGNNIIVNVRSSANIYAGGGGGERGSNGSNGSNGLCSGGQTYEQCGGCPGCPGGWTDNGCWTGGGCNRRQECNWWGNCWWVTSQWTHYRNCSYSYSTSGGTGGTGGNGGPGRGYNYQSGSLSGSSGTGGTGGGGCGATSGGSGLDGASGGNWGSPGNDTSNSGSGGSSGRAIFGSNYSVTGSINSTTVKGSYNP